MMFKVVLAAAVVAVVSAGCGNRVVPSSVSRLDSMINFLTGKSDRIVGGVEATPHSWPWQVALLSRAGAPTAFCGGSIVTDRYVMTAAHCCPSARNGVVRVGAHDLRNNEVNAKTIAIKRIVSHPTYNSGTLNNDFCLLELAETLTFNDHVQPICLADAEDGFTDQECFVTGWGNDVQGISPYRPGVHKPKAERAVHSRLREADQKIVDQAECNSIYGLSSRPTPITATMICGRAPGKDSCQGDSGGPFVCQKNGGPFKLVGVVSWGFGCADPKFPGVYAKTSTALEWIAGVVA